MRLVLVTRRYWPAIGGRESTASRLVAGLVERGAEVTVLTPRWQSTWPAELDHHGAGVLRFAPPGGGFWSSLGWLRRLHGWLKQHRDQFDLVYVSQLKYDAFAVLRAARRGRFPVVLRPEQPGLSGDCHWQLEAAWGARVKRSCQRSAALVAGSALLERELIAAGYPRQRIHKIANGVPVPPPITADQRLMARADLAEANRSLDLDETSPVALFLGRLLPQRGLETLVEAWRLVIARLPRARLWIAGDGPLSSDLWRRIERLGLVGRVVLAGSFDDAEQLLAAADLVVLPTEIDRLPIALLESMAAGLPVVVGDVASVGEYVVDQVTGRRVPPGRVDQLAEAIDALLTHQAEARRLGQAARQAVVERASVEAMVSGHWKLFTRLLGGAGANGG